MPLSTRRKIRWHGQQLIGHIVDAELTLKNMHDLAARQSDYLNEILPGMLLMLEQVRVACVRFTETL